MSPCASDLQTLGSGGEHATSAKMSAVICNHGGKRSNLDQSGMLVPTKYLAAALQTKSETIPIRRTKRPARGSKRFIAPAKK
jgi:hypothetical protein